MSNELIKYAFTGGELSPSLYGRSDLEQYDLGVALAQNWVVDYRGGMSTRAGFEFCEFVKADDKPTRFFEFRFSPNLSNIYLLLFGDNYVRLIQNGSYVLEAPKTITGISGSTFTSAGHEFAVDDWIKLSDIVGITNANLRTFRVASVTANTFTLEEVPSLVAFAPAGAYVSGGTASRIYTINSPYGAADLEQLVGFQRRDLIRFTHNSYPIYNLIRTSETNWAFSSESIGSGTSVVTGLTATPSATGTAGTVFTVTAILADDTETIMAIPVLVTNIVNYTTTAGSLKFSWANFSGAKAYNVYRSAVVSDTTGLTKGYNMGFIAKVSGTTLVDTNIIPDFTKSPPTANNPFAPGAVKEIQVTAGGTGYTATSTVTLTDPTGSGFYGFPIVVGGAVVAVRVILPGTNYTAPVVSFSGGTGATATATASSLTGEYPAVSTVFQQRQIYAATVNEPLTLWAGRPGKYSNFDFSDVTLDNDSYEFEVDSSEIAPIRHLMPMRGGLLIMSQTGIWQLTGGNSGVVTPTNALADPQNYNGISQLAPLKVGADLLYIEGKGFTVRLLAYNDYSKAWAGEDKSILSNHLFSRGRRLSSWTFAENPYKVVSAVRTDGALLHFTIVKEEKVFAWTWSSTKGKFLDCKAIQEDEFDRVYVVTQRKINGRWTKFVERQALRDVTAVEDAFCVDCGLSLGANFPARELNLVSLVDTEATLSVSGGAFFTSTNLGNIIRAAGGKLVITEVLTPTTVKAFLIQPFVETVPEVSYVDIYPQDEGTWTLDVPVSEIAGLWHLEGETVSILADGNVLPAETVVEGKITLPENVTRCHVGIPFTATAKTLPPVVNNATIEARRKRVIGVAVRVNDTVGLLSGTSLDSLYEPKERALELYGEPIQLYSGFRAQLLEPEWSEEGSCYFVQDKPLPATLLGIVFDIEVGDDPD